MTLQEDNSPQTLSPIIMKPSLKNKDSLKLKFNIT